VSRAAQQATMEGANTVKQLKLAINEKSHSENNGSENSLATQIFYRIGL